MFNEDLVVENGECHILTGHFRRIVVKAGGRLIGSNLIGEVAEPPHIEELIIEEGGFVSLPAATGGTVKFPPGTRFGSPLF